MLQSLKLLPAGAELRQTDGTGVLPGG